MFDKSHCKPDRRIRKSKGYTKHQGYVMVHKPSHPNSWKNGYIKLHRLVMECEKGRYLNRDEHVHHKDFNKENNHPSNLEITTMSRHTTTHNYETKKYTSKWDVSEIKKLYEQGDTIREIEKKTGMSKSNVSQYIKKWGISRTEKGSKIHLNNPNNERKITDEEIKTINDLRKKGFSIKKIIKLTGYSRATIYKYLDKKLIS